MPQFKHQDSKRIRCTRTANGKTETYYVMQSRYGCIETGDILTQRTETIFKPNNSQSVLDYRTDWLLSNVPVQVQVVGVWTVGSVGYLEVKIN